MKDSHPNSSQNPRPASVEILSGREVPLGGPRSMTVFRTIPQRQRFMIGAWCLCDHFGPDDVSATGGMDLPAHPHTGLQTVTWLFDGHLIHHDSAGSDIEVNPGQLNIMTSSSGISHTETSTSDVLHGVQLWTALPDGFRNTASHGVRSYSPTPVIFDNGSALVFLGSLLGSTSPVGSYSPLVGAEIRLEPGAVLDIDVDPTFEHGLLVDTGDVELEGTTIDIHEIGYVGVGSDRITIENLGCTDARMLLIGGEPFEEDIIMWWNFIGRSAAEIAQYREEWEAEGHRFGSIPAYPGRQQDGLLRLPAPPLPEVELRPRKNKPPIAQS